MCRSLVCCLLLLFLGWMLQLCSYTAEWSNRSAYTSATSYIHGTRVRWTWIEMKCSQLLTRTLLINWFFFFPSFLSFFFALLISASQYGSRCVWVSSTATSTSTHAHALTLNSLSLCFRFTFFLFFHASNRTFPFARFVIQSLCCPFAYVRSEPKCRMTKATNENRMRFLATVAMQCNWIVLYSSSYLSTIFCSLRCSLVSFVGTKKMTREKQEIAFDVHTGERERFVALVSSTYHSWASVSAFRVCICSLARPMLTSELVRCVDEA